VTPVSSAVVLETKEQYEQNDLDDESDEEQVVSPEPASLVLFAFGVLGGASMWRRRRVLS
jgi:hypothetical protein